jgi:hypothetical protein
MVCSVEVAEDLVPATCRGQNMKIVKPPGFWSMSGAPYPTARNLASPLALTAPSQLLVVDMTWLMELAASLSCTSWAVNRLSLGAVSRQSAVKRVAELDASFDNIDCFEEQGRGRS